MSLTFTAAATPDTAYEAWRANWTPPEPRPMALPGWALIEFSPYGNRGAIFTPEEASNNAIIVSDGYEPRAGREAFFDAEGWLECGTEVIYVGTAGTAIQYGGRTLMRVPRKEIEMYVPKEDE